MNRIVYMMSFPAHCPYLVASLWTLRQHWWDGPVIVYAWPESIDIVRQIAEDRRLMVVASPYEPAYRGRNDQFLSKIEMARVQDGYAMLYLDADTTIHGKLDVLFELVGEYGFCATQFNDWTTATPSIRRRLEWMRPYREHLRQFKLLDDLLNGHLPLPSVNGGVWAARSSSVVLRDWERVTRAMVGGVFIADEVALHLMAAEHIPRGNLCVAMQGGRFNCSPKYQSKDLPDDQVIVRHFHGDSNVRPDKSPKGCALWGPIWQECLAENVGGCREWYDPAMNKWMKLLEC